MRLGPRVAPDRQSPPHCVPAPTPRFPANPRPARAILRQTRRPFVPLRRNGEYLPCAARARRCSAPRKRQPAIGSLTTANSTRWHGPSSQDCQPRIRSSDNKRPHPTPPEGCQQRSVNTWPSWPSSPAGPKNALAPGGEPRAVGNAPPYASFSASHSYGTYRCSHAPSAYRSIRP